jgi:2-phospho-L-lactate/phosphoenolpyruvate guanylyltransferase
MILVPVKDLRNAKQRLAQLLDQSSRTELAQAMIHDILETLASFKGRSDVAVVTSDAFARELAVQYRFNVIVDTENRSETDAIEKATAWCDSRGVTSTLVIPGDIPLVQASELEQIMQVAPAKGSVLVPAADGRGTNAIFRSPASLFPLRFGNDSFKPHLAAAKATGLPYATLSLPGIALDIDNPYDLQQLAAAPGHTRSQALVRKWDLAEYPLAANE